MSGVHAAPSKAWVVLCVSVLAVSGGAIFARLADAPPLAIAAWRVGLAGSIVLPFSFIFAWQELRALRARDLLWTAGAGFFLALHFAAWITSLKYTTVASSVVLVNTNPVWVALLMPWVSHERLSPRGWLGVLLAVTGAVLIGAGDLRAMGPQLFGDSLALAGGLAAALYLLIGRRVRAKVSFPAYVGLCYAAAAVFLWAVVLFAGIQCTGFTSSTWAAFWGMALVSQIVGHGGYNWALRFFTPSLIALTLLGEPLLGSLLAWILFQEAPPWILLLAAPAILAGIVLAATAPAKNFSLAKTAESAEKFVS